MLDQRIEHRSIDDLTRHQLSGGTVGDYWRQYAVRELDVLDRITGVVFGDVSIEHASDAGLECTFDDALQRLLARPLGQPRPLVVRQLVTRAVRREPLEPHDSS